MASQRDIAKSLNLSPATVSKAFRNAADIGAATRARVLKEAARMGYHSPVTRHPVGVPRDTRFIGVFYCGEYDHPAKPNQRTVQHYFDGMSESANAQNASLVLHRLSDGGRELLSADTQPAALRNGILSGLVLVYKFDEEVVRKLAAELPVVTVTHWVPEAACDLVDSDHIGAMQRLVQHLKELGHRRIGFLAPSWRRGYEQSRFSSFTRALIHEGLEPIPAAYHLNHDDDPEDIDAAVSAAEAGMKQGITAFACSSDNFAYRVINRLERKGIQIPQDLSMTGFDELSNPEASKKLTTVRAPFWQMGSTAVEQLMRRIERPDMPPTQLLLDCPLRLGNTTAPL